MKILIVRPMLEYGGASISILRLADALRREGHEPLIAVAGGEMLPQADAQQLRTFRIPLEPGSAFQFMRAVWMLRKIVREEQIDVIHSQHRYANLVCKAVSRLSGVPLVATAHEFKTNHHLLTRLGFPEYTVTFSHRLRRHLIEHFGLQPSRVMVVEMGIHESPPVPSSNGSTVTDQRMSGRIGCIARLDQEKGVDILLEAARHLAKAGRKDVHFRVVGEGPMREMFLASSRKLGVERMFTLAGWVNDIEEIFADLDFLVLPSRSEGFGMVILEGLRHKKPTVASNVGGIPELIEHGRTGLLVPPEDPRRLAEAIRDLLADPGKVRDMGLAGYEIVSKRYFLTTMGKQMVAVYEASRSERQR